MAKRSRRKTDNYDNYSEVDENQFVDEFSEIDIQEEHDEYRRQKKILKHNFQMSDIGPITENQKKAFFAYNEGKNLLLYGVAGTGKTFLATYFAISDLMAGNAKKIIIVRSAVTTRDQGFLPGTLTEKMALYETPYRDVFSSLCNGRRDVYDLLKKKDYLEFMSTSFIRGLTFDDAIIIVDEVQNCTDHEINSILTRVGKNSKVILCGDYRQNDLKMTGKKSQESGINTLIRVAETMQSFSLIEFNIKDIVRSGFVKEYLIARINLNLD
jgi:phosphate starvation-inducible protein PhoH